MDNCIKQVRVTTNTLPPFMLGHTHIILGFSEASDIHKGSLDEQQHLNSVVEILLLFDV